MISCSNKNVNLPQNANTDAATNSSPNKNNTLLDSKNENTESSLSSENQSTIISIEKISDILSTKNNNVIDTLGISDSDLIKSFNNSNFYEPVFRCEKLGILIGFNGTTDDTIDKVNQEDETPNFIIPINKTVIKFDNNINFRIGDNINQLEAKLGKGKIGKDINLKGDKQFSFLMYNINNLEVKFTSIDGDDFNKYDDKISSTEKIIL
jgi:hypothetical protein